MGISIKHCVTVGRKGNGRATIGSIVTINCNAVVVGDITIGDKVIIGAGTVLTKSVPANCIVVGNPAFILKRDGQIVKEII